MKHKRQTLSKNGDETDGKDSPSGCSKKSDKSISSLLQDDKSCQNCELPASAELGGRNNNNSNASSGASSVASSVSSSFDKLATEEDSRSNDGSGATVTSPVASKKPEIKLEDTKLLSNSLACLGKKTPPKENGIPLDVASVVPALPLTPSSAPVTPQASPCGGSGSSGGGGGSTSQALYPQTRLPMQQTQTPTHPVLVNQSRTTGATPYSGSDYVTAAAAAARLRGRGHTVYTGRDSQTFQRAGVIYPDASSGYARQNPHHSRVSMQNNTTAGVGPRAQQRVYPQHPTQQQSYHYYNGYQHTEYSGGYRSTAGYHPQSYSQHANSEEYVNYNYHQTNMYGNTGNEMSLHQSMQQQHHQQSNHEGTTNTTSNGPGTNANPAGYYEPHTTHPYQEDHHSSGYQSKHHYYDHHPPTGMHPQTHQGGEAQQATITNSFVSSPDPFPNGATTVGPGAATAAALAVMTPPTSVQTPPEPADSFGTFHHFYSEPTATVHAPAGPASADNSNSSSDFNFLSNLANDFAPEYYQLS